mmetsp:Transcript_21815/g.49157  ORF Transcript_21815/g.49157 Transcript_21815/m.49157 type:complete len:83 (-) Transcript_21815:577-825(-)|eukprot:CAMPEP_0181200258 /NCGR_PEP_ID=MMETSP1096-20121128/17660_1 /TAXON_ID=156174 ORGANISM="Chrysochromulina ericina, Strain CCMP281" /NCGR_SAMPLE_ID=MMETSP1096 /ASSEMBLY_ACC=CAM_ASM_000453 /LENGTH=82 /DNA_ID=CAMNT_0023290587 /DNA_START=314 /DNA_END=562 /DNA_ORIENTATION=-
MSAMVERRNAALKQLRACTSLLPAGVLDVVALDEDQAYPERRLEYYFPWWLGHLVVIFVRRKKKDWNEVLRLSDYATMDYIE